MEWLQVLQRILAGEDEVTALKQWPRFPISGRLAETICAFANSEGGLLILGVDDGRNIVGVPMDADEVQERLSSWLQSGLSAPVQARLGRHHDPAGLVHWVEVTRTRGPEPLRHKGRILVRRGRNNGDPTPSELQEMYNTFGLVLTEERLVPGTGIEDLEISVFREYMSRKGIDIATEPRIPLEADLKNRALLEDDLDGEARATLYGLLCFGREPQGHAPTRSLWVDLVAYAGMDRGTPVLASGEAKGRLDEQVQRAEAWLRVLGNRERYRGLRRDDVWLVPPAAFREVMVNAVAHRDYSILGSKILVEVFDDRLVVTSPGALRNHLRPASVLAGGLSRSRNEAMANFLHEEGLMEQRGSGYPRIRYAMRPFNGTEPVLETDRDERWVRVTLWLVPPGEE